MNRETLTPESYDALLHSITEILMKNGLKATTMDSIASSLQISKRTLYEIFGSKSEMVSEAIKAFHAKHEESHKLFFLTSDNVMEAMLREFMHHRDIMGKLNVQFFRDMDEHFSEAKIHSDASESHFIDNMARTLMKGAREGYFRKDLNFKVQCRLLLIQFESFKRMEEFFPPEISLLEAYDAVSIGFLRSISSAKGLEEIDRQLRKLNWTTVASPLPETTTTDQQ